MGIEKRIFLVGCPRSGTTMLQTVLAAHPEVWSFPESRIYRNVQSQQQWFRKLGWASHHAPGRLRSIYTELGLDASLVQRHRRVQEYARDFFTHLDEAAAAECKSVWLEKTPEHVHMMDQIRALLPDAQFVHLIRDGAETVASLADVTRRYPEAWGTAPWSVDACIERWNKDVQGSLNLVGDEAQVFVSYERFVADPEAETRRMCERLQLEPHAAMFERGEARAQPLVLESEPWKARSGAEIKPGSGKFSTVFSESEQKRVRAGVAKVQALVDAFLEMPASTRLYR